MSTGDLEFVVVYDDTDTPAAPKRKVAAIMLVPVTIGGKEYFALPVVEAP